MRIHLVADSTGRDGGYVVERLVELGAELVPLDRDALSPFASLGGSDLIVSLGSERAAHEPRWKDIVEAESALVRTALRNGTPVMGICYGAQVMARALGGTSYRADDPELGWRRVDTVDPVLCPEGPWAHLHREVFAPPRTARVLGTSWYGPQCFVDESRGARAIAWQFHPEVTPETFARRVGQDEGYYRAAGADPAEMIRQAHAYAPARRNAAVTLTDAALDYLEVR